MQGYQVKFGIFPALRGVGNGAWTHFPYYTSQIYRLSAALPLTEMAKIGYTEIRITIQSVKEFDIMRIVVSICGVFCTLITIYYAVTSLFGVVFCKRRERAKMPPQKRIAAIIPARNEELVIGKLVESLLRQDYPRALFEVYVVPNNCDDDTAGAARAAGARILNVTGTVRTKGDVLRQAFAQLTGTGKYDAYCVFDADNLVGQGFFRAVNDAVLDGCQVAQGFRDSKNPFDNWVSGSMSVFFWFMSACYNESRNRLGISCHLNGTGFMVSDEAIRSIGWDTHSLTEDLEFTALCALKGYKVGWMPEARIYDEQTTSFKTSCVQRRRWTAGSLQCMRRYVPRLIGKGSVACWDMAVLFLGNLMCIIGIVPAIGTALGMLPFFISHPWRILALVLLGVVYYLVICAGGAMMFKLQGKLNRRALPGIFGLPIFLATWMPINIYACLTPPPRWKEVRHVRSIDRPDDGKGGEST